MSSRLVDDVYAATAYCPKTLASGIRQPLDSLKDRTLDWEWLKNRYLWGRSFLPYAGSGWYPLVADALKLCFALDALPAGKSVEDLFADALQAGNYKPMEVLVDRLMEADYRIAQKLATSASSNSYREFFDSFQSAHFLTFNYDSLPEYFSLSERSLASRRRLWSTSFNRTRRGDGTNPRDEV